ncbi:hypothetical protein BKP45_10985 [Anaerobacillus alkalidiazotrophicus]|uniref:Uncharacterized protein n=1 Tax=Anaerobacillus alkalidiazotrophicus TaxID=472963 RepID=A0A1S2M556_9BACI|nr:hypothetical protein [Anaerobacillus alkalidiazotrophicus]OIJ19593.1 hypothetical protein BKP45_10985 [Anaerobacillus alkalidiazotrophicus]
MKKKILAAFFLLLVVVIAGCNGGDDTQETETVTFSKEAFDISLLDNTENFVNISPEGKTIYAYFTGVG